MEGRIEKWLIYKFKRKLMRDNARRFYLGEEK